MLSETTHKTKSLGKKDQYEYKHIIESLMGTFLYRLDTKGGFDYVSASVHQILGYT